MLSSRVVGTNEPHASYGLLVYIHSRFGNGIRAGSLGTSRGQSREPGPEKAQRVDPFPSSGSSAARHPRRRRNHRNNHAFQRQWRSRVVRFFPKRGSRVVVPGGHCSRLTPLACPRRSWWSRRPPLAHSEASLRSASRHRSRDSIQFRRFQAFVTSYAPVHVIGG